jgi:CBS domain-containing protein
MSSEIPAVTVGEVMHAGVIATAPQTPVLEVAASMARHRVHCVVVEGLARDSSNQEHLVWGILSDLDLMRALAGGGGEATAGELASTEIVTVEPSERLEQVAALMAEHGTSHLVVADRVSGEPVGVISTLDVAQGITVARQLEV